MRKAQQRDELFYATATGHRGNTLWTKKGSIYRGLMEAADREAPTASSVVVRGEYTSDGTHWGVGSGRVVAAREHGRWLIYNPDSLSKHLREIAEESGLEEPVYEEMKKTRFKGHVIESWHDEGSSYMNPWNAFAKGFGSRSGATRQEAVDKVKLLISEPRRNPSSAPPEYPDTLPTDEEIASALMYITSEFRLTDGIITGEHWAEGLAFGRDQRRDGDFKYHLENAREIRRQLPEEEWRRIGARASYVARDQYLSDWGVRGGEQR